MARARTLKPGFFKNEQLAECEPLARILFEGLWCEADREGRLEDRPKRLKAEILPYDDCDIDDLLRQLAENGLISRYEIEETKYIQVLKFSKHQNPHPKETASAIPAMASREITRQDAERSNPETENPERAGPITLSPLPIPDSKGCVIDAADVPNAPEKSPAVQLIEVYDSALVDVFGSERRRPWPGAMDCTIAERFVSSGATPEICRGVFTSVFKRFRGKGQDPPALSYFEKPIANALAEKNRPLPPANSPQSKPYDAMDDYKRMVVDI